MEKEVLGRTKPINFWRWYRMIFGGILNRDKTNFPSGKVIIKKLYNGEFDPGSGWTLATGLTHASRGVTSGRACSSRMTTGARVSNAYPTWPIPRDSPSKGGLMPDGVRCPHGRVTKGNGRGWGCDWLASWRGNGPPRLRSVGVLRGRSPTLELRHGPNSYGRQQWGILVNGRESEPAK